MASYELFQNGTELLEERGLPRRDRAAARARATSSPTRPRSARRSAARCSARSATARRPQEFEAVVEHAPTNDYALFCLGRALQQLGRHDEARQPLALAACLRPERADYRTTATARGADAA